MRSSLTDIAAWKTFEKIVRTGSFPRAAIELDTSVSTVSRTLSQLEADLGVPLVVRTVRPLEPTPFALSLLERLQPMLEKWSEFDEFLTAEARGRSVVRLSTPAGIGRFYLNAQLAEYHAIEPGVIVETSLEKGTAELLSREIDVAFLPYMPDQPDLKVYPAMQAFTMPLASAEYVASRGKPHRPEELSSHTLVLKSGGNFPQALHLVFRGQKKTVCWKHAVFHQDMLNVKDAVLRGFGIGLDVPLGMVLDELRQGLLVPILDGWHRDYWHYSIVTRAQDGPKTAVGRFAAWYAERATREINERRAEGFRILGLNPEQL